MLPGMELMGCANLAVPPDVMKHVVRVESSFNPYAIGVVGARLARQPRNLPEAVSTARMLEREGYNFSLGLAQVNRHNLAGTGLDSYEKAFDVCPNLRAGSRILADCYRRSGQDWGKAFSCYYSGNFVTGFRHGYVQKVMTHWRREAGDMVPAIDVVERRTASAPGASATLGGLPSLVLRRIESAAAPVAQREVAPSGQGLSAMPAPPQVQAQQLPPGAHALAMAAAVPDDAPVVVQPMGAPAPVPHASPHAASTPSGLPARQPRVAASPRDEAFVF